MKNSPREEKIISIINEKGFMSVAELSERLFTSPSSIRRDLALLEKKKLIKRTHGGAASLRDTKRLSPFLTRKEMNTEAKASAANHASYLIHDSMSVMLDGSSSALAILPHLKEHDGIEVFTNSIYTYQRALEMGLTAYCLGGGTSEDCEILSGSITEDTVSRLFTDILFFSSKCVSETGDITDPIDSENRLRRVMLRHAKIKVFLYDTSKLGKFATYKLCNISELDYAFSELGDTKM